MRPMRAYILGLAALGTLACANAGEDFGFEPVGSGTVAAFIYLDRNGDLNPSQGGIDTAFGGVRLGLVVAGTTDTVFSALTDALGNVVFSNVPFGSYRFVVDTNTVGDSIQVQAIDSTSINLRADAQQALVTVRLGFPAMTVAQARQAAAGRRVLVQGMILSALGVFGDSSGFLLEGGVAIRLTGATLAGPAAQAGDSVRVLGTVSARAGQPVLDEAAVTVYRISFSSPPGTSTTTQQAGIADTTALDAALVAVTGAVISDTATIGNDFHVGMDDGSGRLVMVLDGDVNFQRALFDIGKTVAGDGILVPTGTGTWVFKPRNQNDVTIT